MQKSNHVITLPTASRERVRRRQCPSPISPKKDNTNHLEDFPRAMVFKPFKPPLMRKPANPPSTSDEASPLPRDTNIDNKQDGPPAKKPRLEGKQLSATAERKPLPQVRDQVSSSDNGKDNGDGSGEEKYFNALWYGIPRTNIILYMDQLSNKKQITGANLPPRKTKPGTAMGF